MLSAVMAFELIKFASALLSSPRVSSPLSPIGMLGGWRGAGVMTHTQGGFFGTVLKSEGMLF